ncbi:hypothetical protein HYW60_04250 [Candidatus Kaiserbacteria bacterium]|nr:hypothetical protein [Candidatus Kaiserbacteria bacterium]
MPTSSVPQSFIPHEAPVAAGPVRRSGKGLADLFALIAIVLLVASVALAIGIFLYREYLAASAASKIEQLERAKAAFEPSLIAELTRLDDRMQAASEILQKHIAPSAIFEMLERNTIGSVGFTSLDFEVADAENMAVQMDGVAGSVNGIALQADLFSEDGMFTSPVFSNINREIDGVHFSLSASVDPLAINFAQLLVVPPAPAAPQQTFPFGAPSISPIPEGGASLGEEENNL